MYYKRKNPQYKRQFYQLQPEAQQQPEAQPAPQSPEPAPQRTFDEVADFCRQMGLPAEVIGRWIWCSFSQKPDPETLKAMKDFGFRWSHRRQAWSHNCGHPSRPGNGNPREKYPHYWLEDESDDRKRNVYRNQERRYAS